MEPGGIGEQAKVDRWQRMRERHSDRSLPLRVLVCDDERNIVRLIQVNLQRHEYLVVAAFDGREALEKIRTERPDLCILDIIMPYVDGLEVLRKIRKDPDSKDMPVIMLTTEASEQNIAVGLSAGADLYLTKPFNPLDLVKLLDEK